MKSLFFTLAKMLSGAKYAFLPTLFTASSMRALVTLLRQWGPVVQYFPGVAKSISRL